MNKRIAFLMTALVLLSSIPITISEETFNPADTLILRPESQHINHAGWDTIPDVGGEHWQNVDDVTPDYDATVVYGDWATDMWGLPDHTTETGTIQKITAYLIVKADVASDFTIRIGRDATLLVHGSSSQSSTTSWETYNYEWFDCPWTSISWTWGDIDILNLGIATYSNDNHSVTQGWIEVTYGDIPGDEAFFRPDGQGDYHAWVSEPDVSPNNYLNVDEEIADDGTTLVKSGSSYYDYYTLDDHTTEMGEIYDVTAYVRAERDSGFFNYLSYSIGDGTDWHSYSETGITTSWDTYNHSWLTCPWTATNWTWWDIDDLIFTIYRSGDGGIYAYVTQCYIRVRYESEAIPQEVWVDDDYNAGTPGWQVTHFDVIQDGIDAVYVRGTVNVLEGSYTEDIDIDKRLELVGEGWNDVTVNGIIYITADYVNVSGVKVTTGFSGEGILLFNVDHCCIFECNITGCEAGIAIELSDYNNISNNEIFDNSEIGIAFSESKNNDILENNISENDIMGLYTEGNSDDNYILRNNFIDNTGNAWDECSNTWTYVAGNYWSDFDEPSEGAWDNDSNGFVDAPYSVPGGGGNQDLLPLIDPWDGSYPTPPETVTNVDTGMTYSYIQDAIDAALPGHTISVGARTYYETIEVDKKLTIEGESPLTTILDGSNLDDVIHVTADEVTIKSLTLQNGATYVLFVDNADDGYFTRLEFINGDVEYDDSNMNTMYENNFSSNSWIYIYDYSSDNIFTNNNFFVTCGGVDDPPFGDSGNRWNETYPQGGNYWHDHWFQWDNLSGPDQDIPGSDGIWDKPYNVGRAGLDNYPLADPIEFGVYAPRLYDETPANALFDVDIAQGTVSIRIEDDEPFDWTIEGKHIQNTGSTGDSNGVKTANLLTPLPYYTSVIWYVNATDGVKSVSATYYFKTEIYDEMEINYVDDNFDEDDSQWHKSYWNNIQDAIDTVEDGGTIMIRIGTYHENLWVNKPVNFIGEDKDLTVIQGDSTQGGTVERTIEVSNEEYPTFPTDEISGVSFTDLTITNEYTGVQSSCLSLRWAGEVDVYNCHLEDGWAGISTTPKSNNITIKACTFDNFDFAGITLNCIDVTIYYNDIQGTQVGIDLQEPASFVHMEDNNIHENTFGTKLLKSVNCTIIENVYEENDRCAIDMHDSYNNTVYHNNFVGNNDFGGPGAKQAKDTVTVGVPDTIWDNNYPDGGNYWDDFDEESEGAYDRYHGINQDLEGRDGIVDGASPNPYIFGDNEDGYPLMYPWVLSTCLGVDFTWVPKYPEPGEKVIFYETACSLDVAKRRWGFGDGKMTVAGSATTYHTYGESGEYEVQLEIEDVWGDRDIITKTIYVGNMPRIPPIQPPKYPGFTVPEMYQLLHAIDLPKSNNKVTIMVIDSGIVPRQYEGIDLSKIIQEFDPSFGVAVDENGHGTWCSYAIAYLVQTKLPNAKQISYKVFGASGESSTEVFLSAFERAKQLKPDVVSISAGVIGGKTNDLFSRKCEELRRAGIIVIVAAGNYGPSASTITSPAVSDSTIAIAGSDPQWYGQIQNEVREKGILNLADDTICDWSSRGPVPGVKPKPDATAPGESIIGPWKNEEKAVSGTSMATPLVAGGAIVIVAENKDLIDLVKTIYFWDKSVVPNAFEDALKAGCQKKGDENTWGAGIIQFDDVSADFRWRLAGTIAVGLIPWILLIILIIIIISYIYYKKRGKDFPLLKRFSKGGLPKWGKK